MFEQHYVISSQDMEVPQRVRSCRWLRSKLLWVWGTLFLGIASGTIANLFTTTIGTTGETGVSLRDVLSKLFVVQFVRDFPFPVFTSLGILFLMTILSWLGSRWNISVLPPSPQERQHLLSHLRVCYGRQVSQFLPGAVQLKLRLALQPATVQKPPIVNYLSTQEQVLPPLPSIIEIYEHVGQKLLILGEPGIGKSTLLQKLAHHLLEQAEQDSTRPIPVLLPLSLWGNKHSSLPDWLIEQFARLYGISRKRSQQWVQVGLVVPLLDGLDEMEESARPTCIKALNSYCEKYSLPLVVCSRTNEYKGAATYARLQLHGAVEVRSFSPKQVDAYLAQQGEPLDALRSVLRQNATLAALATTPLMLQVLIETYQEIAMQQLSHEVVVLQQEIWTAYIKRMVALKRDIKHYPLRRTVRWLSWLARQMRERNQTVFSLEMLQPDVLPKEYFDRYRRSVWILGGLFGILISGLVFGLLGGLVSGLQVGLAFGFSSGLVVGLFIAAYLSSEKKIEFPDLVRLSWQNWFMFVLGLAMGLFFGVLMGEVPFIGMGFGLFGGLLFGMAIGLGVGFAAILQHYTLRFWLARLGLFPWKATPFLEYATACVLLQRVGKGYSFRHQLLLDYFADLDAAPPFTSASAGLRQ